MKNIGNIFILGDSYSTFKGFIPEEFATYYSFNKSADNDVNHIDQTWWKQILDSTESELIRNCSFSGTTICHTGYGGEDCKHKSFVARIEKLISKDFFNKNKINTLFIFGGTNDSWANSPIGELNFGEKTEKELYSVLPAVCRLFEITKSACPDTRIIVLINDILKDEITNGLIKACKYYSLECLLLKNIDKQSGHPSVLGMKQISEQIMNIL